MHALFPTASRKWKGNDQRSEGGDIDKWRVKMEEQGRTREEESPPSINLGLGIGGPISCCSSTSNFDHHKVENNRCVSGSGRMIVKVEVDGDDQVVKDRKKQRNTECSVVRFTEEQLEELKTQILIFKCMVSGLPFPLHPLPIWRSLSSSFAPPHWRTPFFSGFYHLGLDNRYMMDPEPGRCRRTDGKKWRCHKSVVPNEKYCENHMHRGRKRSRKLVEASTATSSPHSRTLNPTNANRSDSTNDNLRIEFPANLDHKPQPPIYKNPTYIEAKDVPTRVVIRAPSLSLNYDTVKINENDKEKSAGNLNSVVKERITVINLSSGLDFSPKSVLQGGLRCPRVEMCENNPNSEPGRCRRTDGKKWRCSNKVLPQQKYCAHHMNRGSKKPSLALSTSGGAKPNYNGPELTRMGLGLGLDTNLNFSNTTGSGQLRPNTEDDSVAGSGGSGSTTETTVTDDSTTFLDMTSLSS